jgi:hypothetical protein
MDDSAMRDLEILASLGSVSRTKRSERLFHVTPLTPYSLRMRLMPISPTF